MARARRRSGQIVGRVRPKANFGAVTVNGAEEVDQDFIAGYRSWRAGEQYSPERVRETRRDLAQTNLFDSVIVKVAGPVNDNGEIPVEIEVVERKMRSIGGGVNFSTADGPGANAFWEHRNLFGAGLAVDVETPQPPPTQPHPSRRRALAARAVDARRQAAHDTAVAARPHRGAA